MRSRVESMFAAFKRGSSDTVVMDYRADLRIAALTQPVAQCAKMGPPRIDNKAAAAAAAVPRQGTLMAGIIELRHTEQELHYRAKKWERNCAALQFLPQGEYPPTSGPASVVGVELSSVTGDGDAVKGENSKVSTETPESREGASTPAASVSISHGSGSWWLSLYKPSDDGSGASRGSIQLTPDSHVMHTGLSTESFVVITPFAVLHLMATSFEERDLWADCLERAIDDSTLCPHLPARTLGVAARFIHAEPEREILYSVRRPLGFACRQIRQWLLVTAKQDSAPEGIEIGLVLRQKDDQSLDLSDYDDVITSIKRWNPPMTLGFCRQPQRAGHLHMARGGPHATSSRRRTVVNARQSSRFDSLFDQRYFRLHNGCLYHFLHEAEAGHDGGSGDGGDEGDTGRITGWGGIDYGDVEWKEAAAGTFKLEGACLRVINHSECMDRFGAVDSDSGDGDTSQWHCFLLLSATGGLLLHADSDRERDLWCSTLCHAICIANGGHGLALHHSVGSWRTRSFNHLVSPPEGLPLTVAATPPASVIAAARTRAETDAATTDEDSTGVGEFKLALTRSSACSNNVMPAPQVLDEELCSRAFDTLDHRGNGHIGRGEFALFLRSVKQQTSQESLKDIFARVPLTQKQREHDTEAQAAEQDSSGTGNGKTTRVLEQLRYATQQLVTVTSTESIGDIARPTDENAADISLLKSALHLARQSEDPNLRLSKIYREAETLFASLDANAVEQLQFAACNRAGNGHVTKEEFVAYLLSVTEISFIRGVLEFVDHNHTTFS